jgi:hypothetical protein
MQCSRLNCIFLEFNAMVFAKFSCFLFFIFFVLLFQQGFKGDLVRVRQCRAQGIQGMKNLFMGMSWFFATRLHFELCF